ncbi:MAG: hypothetical protein LCH41_04440 [Armatimonadetes bacterium]|nr:hypothetical protein [Armatimonadota bacterium]
MGVISAILLLGQVARSPVRAPLQQWARGEWSRQDKAYSQILDEVRPFYGKDGFIDEDVVEKKYEYHVNQYLQDKGNSLKLMRALAWHELTYSDYNFARTESRALIQRKFIQSMRLWSRPVDSFSFVRTMAICTYLTTSPDMFVENRLLEKLYAKDPSDTELELIYIVWLCMNQEVSPSRLPIERLLQKQEKIEFRKGTRLFTLSMCYNFASFHAPPSRRLMEKGFQLKLDYLAALPPGHINNNTADYRAKVFDSIREKRKQTAHWKD